MHSQNFIDTSWKDAVASQLDSIAQELKSIDKVTAGKDPAKLSTRIKWVLKSGETDRALQRLEKHKTSLIFLLQALSSDMSGQILRSQKLVDARLGALESILERQSRNESMMGPDVDRSAGDLSLKIDTPWTLLNQTLQDGIASLSTEVKISGGHAGNTICTLLESQMRPFFEEVLSKSATQNAANLREFKMVINDATSRISKTMVESERVSNLPAIPRKPKQKAESPHDFQSMTRALSRSGVPRGDDKTNSVYLQERPTLRMGQSKRYSVALWTWSYWKDIRGVGSIRIDYSIKADPCHRFWTVKIHIWPSSTFLNMTGFSLKYSSRPDRQGYVALCPSLAVYPIIPDDDLIWTFIRLENVDGIKTRLKDGKNGLFDRNSNGYTFICYAALAGCYKSAQFLLSQGADPTQICSLGDNALNLFVYDAIDQCITGYGTVGYDFDLQLFTSTFHSLIAAGCDLDDIGSWDLDFWLQSEEFQQQPLNRDPLDREFDFHLAAYEKRQFLQDEWSDTDSTESLNEASMEATRSIVDLSSRGPWGYRGWQGPNEVHYLSNIRNVSEFLSRAGIDFIGDYLLDPFELLGHPKKMTLGALQAFGFCRVSERSPFRAKPFVIYAALYSLIPCNEPCRHEGCGQADPIRMDNLVGLLLSGLEVYDEVEWTDELWWAGDDDYEDGLITPTIYAKNYGIIPLWLKGLKRAGYDPDEVLVEDARRRREYVKLRGGKSSAISAASEAAQCSLRLRRRRARDNDS